MDQWEPDAAEESISQVVRDRAIFPVFQPIRDLTTGALVAVEALARGPAGSAVESAPALFAAARAAGQLSRVDQLAFTRAIEVARESPRPLPLLFANAEPAVLNEAPQRGTNERRPRATAVPHRDGVHRAGTRERTCRVG